MLEKLLIEETRETPEIHFDKESNTLRIKGRSLPENPLDFYAPAIQWLQEYLKEPNKETTLVIFLEYLNSGSLKQLFRIIYLVEELMELGEEAKIVWTYKREDELMYQKGLEFKQFLDIPIELSIA